MDSRAIVVVGRSDVSASARRDARDATATTTATTTTTSDDDDATRRRVVPTARVGGRATDDDDDDGTGGDATARERFEFERDARARGGVGPSARPANGFERARIERERAVEWLGLPISARGATGANDAATGRGVGGGAGGERERRRARRSDGGGLGERIRGRR